MNDTKMATERLESFVDGELSPEDAAAVLMHLANAPEDRAYVERLERVNQALIDLYAAPLALPVPEDLRRRILGPEADWTRAANGPRAPRRAWLLAGAAMAASVALVLGLSLTRDAPPGFHVSTGTVAGRHAALGGARPAAERSAPVPSTMRSCTWSGPSSTATAAPAASSRRCARPNGSSSTRSPAARPPARGMSSWP